MDALHLYLHTLVPEINDVFIVTFALVNLFCWMDLFLTSGGIAKIFLCFFWQLAKLNLLFILLWLPLQWTFQLSLIAPLSNLFWWGVRVLCQTGIVGQLRQDWLLYSHHWGIICFVFALYCFVCGWFLKKCRPQRQEDNLSSIEWIRLVFHQWHLFMIRPRYTRQQGGPQTSSITLEDGMDLFLERSMPDLWLHPVITGEYVHNLPQWKYGGLRKPPEENCLNHLCVSCQESWRRFFCMMTKEDGSERHDASDHQIWHMFAERASGQSRAKSNGANGSKTKEFYEVFENGCRLEKEIVKTQPTKGLQGYERDVNLFEEKLCQDCLSVICDMEEAESKKGISLKEPPHLLKLSNHGSVSSERDAEEATDGGTHLPGSRFDPWPEEMLPSSECAICLEGYVQGSHLCGLPCGHTFHFDCVKVWLCGGKHCCPTCRWPAFKRKPSKLSKYME